jgi:uncharacterized protein (TIGR04255 family)
MIEHYDRLAEPEAATQLGIRYINRIDFAEPAIDMAQYFNVHPTVPDSLGGSHGSFLLRVELPTPPSGAHVLLTLGSAPPQLPNGISLMLDIYARLPVPDGSALMPHIRATQSDVERTFEHTITDPLRSRFGVEAGT